MASLARWLKAIALLAVLARVHALLINSNRISILDCVVVRVSLVLLAILGKRAHATKLAVSTLVVVLLSEFGLITVVVLWLLVWLLANSYSSNLICTLHCIFHLEFTLLRPIHQILFGCLCWNPSNTKRYFFFIPRSPWWYYRYLLCRAYLLVIFDISLIQYKQLFLLLLLDCLCLDTLIL